MKRMLFLTMITACGALASGASAAAEPTKVPPAPNGIEFPAGYRDWRVISISQRTDNHTMRAILGNDIAVEAARSGHTHPWPNGAALGKVVWKEGQEKHWATALAPQEFVHAEFMFKDAAKWAATGGWGYARWVGAGLKPYGTDANFGNECMGCHTPAKDDDWVFTTPAKMVVMPVADVH